MFGRRGSRESGEAEAKRLRRPRGRKARLLFELQAQLDEARQQLEGKESTIRQIAGDLAAEQSNHPDLASRVAEIQTKHAEEVGQMRAARAQALARLKASIDRHRSEVMALEHALDYQDRP
jgi:chromosome segregation ATPase